MKKSWDREASKTRRERSRVDGGFVVVAVVVVEACSKALPSRTGASVCCSRSCWRPLSCCLRLLLVRPRGASAKAKTRRGGSGERVGGRLGCGVEGAERVEGVPAPAGRLRSVPLPLAFSSFSSSPSSSPSSSSPPSSSPSTPPLLPLSPFNFPFLLVFPTDEPNSCFINREQELREDGCGGVPSLVVVRGI